MPREESQDLLRIEGLRTSFRTGQGLVSPVDGVDLAVPRGRTLGIVGESGCGKSMLSLSIMGLVPPPGRIGAGKILLEGVVVGFVTGIVGAGGGFLVVPALVCGLAA